MKYIELECYNWMFSEYGYTLNPFPQVPKVGGSVVAYSNHDVHRTHFSLEVHPPYFSPL